MWWLTSAVSAHEVAQLLREGADLIERGGTASNAEWLAYQECKIALLDRMANDPGPFTDPDEAAYLKQVARSEADALRMGARSLLGDL